AAGLKPVTLAPELSKACELHARYLVRNNRDPSVPGLEVHQEDAGSPGCSVEGEKTAKRSVITGGHEPTAAVDASMATLFHRIDLLKPDLKRVGFGYAKGGKFGWVCVLDVGE